jgi:acylphosphatase
LHTRPSLRLFASQNNQEMEEATNIKHFQIHLEGAFGETGFGFSCMKRAYELEISGRLKYITPHKVDIWAKGQEAQLMEFYRWCISCSETRSGEYDLSPRPPSTGNLRQGDLGTLRLCDFETKRKPNIEYHILNTEL